MHTTVPDTTDTRPYELAVDITGTPVKAHPDQPAADDIAAALNQIAAVLKSNPDLVQHVRHTPLLNVNIPISTAADQRAAIAAMTRAALLHGATAKKQPYGTGDTLFGAKLTFGPISLHVYGDRDQVCERVVVGTREVTEEVPDPEALAAVPKVTVTRTVEDVRWECRPLLADSQDGTS